MAFFAHIGGFVVGAVMARIVLLVSARRHRPSRSADAVRPHRPWDNPAMDDGLVEMVVESVRVHMLSSRHVVILKEADRDRYLPDLDRPVGGQRDRDEAPGPDPGTAADPRPVRHDARGARGARSSGSSSASWPTRRSTPGSCSSATASTIEVDARPSDALALAVRSGVRIFAADAVLEQAALGDSAIIDDGEGGEGSTLEATGENVVDPRLDVFRDFVNSLDVDAEGEGRSS